jgi:hypothetical protein
MLQRTVVVVVVFVLTGLAVMYALATISDRGAQVPPDAGIFNPR